MTLLQNSFIPVVARILMAAIFLGSGFSKIGGFDGTVQFMQSAGLPMANLLLPIVIVLEIGGGLALIVGAWARIAALLLAGFTLLAAVLFHNFWAMPAEMQMVQQIMFMKNLAITGGLLMVVYFGSGPYAVKKEASV